MADDSEMTIESLQAQVLELKAQLEKANTDIATVNDSLKKSESALADARAVNGKLMQGVSIGMLNTTPTLTEEPVELTYEERVNKFCDDYIQPAVDKMAKLYGDRFNSKGVDINGNDN